MPLFDNCRESVASRIKSLSGPGPALGPYFGDPCIRLQIKVTKRLKSTVVSHKFLTKSSVFSSSAVVSN